MERRVIRAYIGGVLTSFVIIMLLLGWAIANAEVPHNAEKYKRDLIRNARAIWGIDAPIATFAAQIHQESAWEAEAKSRVGATGLAQFMPSTASWISGAYPHYLGDNQPTNPVWAIRALVTYNRFLYNRVSGVDHCEQMAFALASYNGGLGWTNKRKLASPDPLVCIGVTCEINPGILPSNQKENSEYPKRILLRHEPVYASGWFIQGSCPNRS